MGWRGSSNNKKRKVSDGEEDVEPLPVENYDSQLNKVAEPLLLENYISQPDELADPWTVQTSDYEVSELNEQLNALTVQISDSQMKELADMTATMVLMKLTQSADLHNRG